MDNHKLDVKTHVNFLLKKYNLFSLYYKFIGTSIVSSLLKESFYWTLIYFSITLENKNHIKKVAGLLFGILFTNKLIPQMAFS